MLSFDGEFQIGSVFDGEYEFHSSFDGELFVGEVITAEEHEIYHGQTTVVPLVETSTTLHTENKIIKENILVLPIPYYEVSNVVGTTVVIGG